MTPGRTRIALAIICANLLFTTTSLPAQSAPAESVSAINPAIMPKDRLGEGWWAARHEAILARIKSDPDAEMIFLGDSITQNYEKNKLPDENFQLTRQQFYAPREALNLGFSGDATENVLWRLDHGEVDGLHPAVAVLLIGANNTGFLGESSAQTEAGIDAVVAKLESKLPQTRILLLAILPSGVAPNVVADNLEINRYLAAKYGSETGNPSTRVTYLDIGSIFFKAGKLDESLYYDPRLPQHGKPLHPDTQGQRRMAEAIEPTLTHLLADSGRQYLVSLDQVNSALIPVPRLEMDSYDWYKRHQEILRIQKKLDPQIVLIGDSITHFWGGEPRSNPRNGPKSWNETFAGIPVLNMGFGWDRTQNVLWRMEQGELDGLHPKTVVINIGTNNLTATENARSNTPEEIVQAILAIHDAVRRKSPESRILVMGILPRGFSPFNPYRAPILKVNELLAEQLDGKENTKFLDIGKQYLAADGTLPVALMNDGTHPTDQGYAIWAKALIDAGIRK